MVGPWVKPDDEFDEGARPENTPPLSDTPEPETVPAAHHDAPQPRPVHYKRRLEPTPYTAGTGEKFDILRFGNYGDALEHVRTLKLGFHLAGEQPPLLSVTNILMLGCSGCTSYILGIVFGAILSEFFDFASTGTVGIVVVLTWCTGAILYALSRTRRVELRGGELVLHGRALFRKTIQLHDILWVSAHGAHRYLYLRSGRRIRYFMPWLRRSARMMDFRITKVIFELALMQTKEQAGYTAESSTEVKLPLTQWSTWRRVPWIIVGLPMLAPLAVLVAVAVITATEATSHSLALLFTLGFYLIIPGVILLLAFIAGMKRFFSAYGFRAERFTPEGFGVGRGRIVPYEQLRLVLFRGSGRVEAPQAGLLEITFGDGASVFIGPERENFFLLPFVLREWAKEKFKCRPVRSLPPGVEKMQIKEFIWFPPKRPPTPDYPAR